MVGGELTLEALELSYNPRVGLLPAPVQALANGGVLVIDDFGRQRVAARDLLNRWIVPLESRVDYLTLTVRPEVRGAVHGAGGRSPPTSSPPISSTRRSFAAFTTRCCAESPTHEDLRADLPERLLRRARRSLRRGPGRSICSTNYYKPRDIRTARLPSARPDRSGAVARRVSREPPALTPELLRCGVRQLLRGRDRGDASRLPHMHDMRRPFAVTRGPRSRCCWRPLRRAWRGAWRSRA